MSALRGISGGAAFNVAGDELDLTRAVFDADSIVVREYRRRIFMQRLRGWRPRLSIRVRFALMPRTQRRLARLQSDVSRANIQLETMNDQLRELRRELKERA